MGRELKRVPLGFDWPINKTWFGYVLESVPCQLCGGEGRPRHRGKVTTYLYDDETYESEYCPACDGEGNCWPEVEIPTGPGYQMWEDTSEGSPISPVFKTPEELARWLADTGASAFGRMTATYEQWLNTILGPGYSVGMVMHVYEDGSSVMESGVAATPPTTQEQEEK